MAHEKVYAFCENFCKEETMTKEQIEDKIDDKIDENIAVVEGSLYRPVVAAEGKFSTGADYPEGFNKNNCVVVAFGSFLGNYQGDYYYGDSLKNGSNLGYNGADVGVSLGDDFINMYILPYVDGYFYYKITLMKIA
ncbi:MAG: hypothetical protein MJ245_00320 [Clostridia bacterium]|nr:hypothetical protein [Clostridia bacterium]